MRLPHDICPRVTCVAYATIGETHLIDGCMCTILRDVVLFQPMNERTQWRSLGIGFEQTVVLHTLQHDDPVPVFPDKDKTLRDVHTLDTFQNMIQRFEVTAGSGVVLIFCCHKLTSFIVSDVIRRLLDIMTALSAAPSFRGRPFSVHSRYNVCMFISRHCMPVFVHSFTPSFFHPFILLFLCIPPDLIWHC